MEPQGDFTDPSSPQNQQPEKKNALEFSPSIHLGCICRFSRSIEIPGYKLACEYLLK